MHLIMLQGKKVKLYDPELLRRERENCDYLLSLDTRAIMLHFEMEAGIFNASRLPSFIHGGWESPLCQVRGHFMGHWLSAAAMRYNATGNQILKARADDMIEILEHCQQENGDGWAGPIPEKYLYRIAQGKQVWAPQYVIHKVFMGLVDMFKYAGSDKALAIADQWAEWFFNWTAKFSREEMDDILDFETGGMLEIWADLYGITGKEMYLILMKRYYRARLFDSLLEGNDPLTNMHANTTIAEVIGCARAYEVTGDERWRSICEAYWKCAVSDRGYYVTGGQTLDEVWLPKHQIKVRLGDSAQEHCTVYNMMRLADYLFRWSGESIYADYIERNLYNGIMAQTYWKKEDTSDRVHDDNPDSGLLTYYLPMRSGGRKAWINEKENFFCCHGTAVQANAVHNRYIYYQDENTVYVCQYFDSDVEFDIEDHHVKLSQRIDMQANSSEILHHPECKQVSFTVNTQSPLKMVLKLRVPYWTEGIENENGYVVFERIWNDGDTVSITFCMKVNAETMPDDEDIVAFTYGPMVLAGLTDSETLLYLDGKNAESVIVRESERAAKSWTERFKVTGQERGIRLIPLYKVGYEPYEIYFPLKR